MHIHIPKPLHGWREFFGEVAVIVLGVLIALTAEQIVERWHWREQVQEFRTAVDNEIGYDLSIYQFRLQQGPCVKRRLRELEQWLDASSVGKSSKLARQISLPMRLSPRIGAWGGRSGDISNHIPIDERLAYGAFYDNLANFEDHALEERGIFRDLAAFNRTSELLREDQMKLGMLIDRERVLDSTIDLNYKYSTNAAGKLGVHSKPDPADPVPDDSLCASVLPASGQNLPLGAHGITAVGAH